MKKKLLLVFAHYASGLFRACWKAGIHAIKLNGGVAVAAEALPKVVPIPSFGFMMSIFAAAFFWQAIDYFDDNPLPDLADMIDQATAGAPATATSAAAASAPSASS